MKIDMSDSDITSAKKWQEFFDEFNNESSRGSALITAAFLDAQLQKLIENHFISDPQTIKIIFEEKSGSLSKFYVKIQIAQKLGLITKEMYDDLKIIGQIRNIFAHDMVGLSFEDERIVNLCNRLHSGKIPFEHIERTPENTFRTATTLLIGKLGIEVQKAIIRKGSA